MDESRIRFHEVIEAYKGLFRAYDRLARALLPAVTPATYPLFKEMGRAQDRLTAAILGCEAIYRAPHEAFWNGFAMGLLKADRLDLLEEYPEADRAAVRIEAERLLASSPPPPVS